MKITNKELIRETKVEDITIELENGDEIIATRVDAYGTRDAGGDGINYDITSGEDVYNKLSDDERDELDDLIMFN